MAKDTKSPLGLHLFGLVLAGLLGWACYGLYLYVPGWIRETFLQSFGNLVTFVAAIALLTLAERIWVAVSDRLHLHPPE